MTVRGDAGVEQEQRLLGFQPNFTCSLTVPIPPHRFIIQETEAWREDVAASRG